MYQQKWDRRHFVHAPDFNKEIVAASEFPEEKVFYYAEDTDLSLQKSLSSGLPVLFSGKSIFQNQFALKNQHNVFGSLGPSWDSKGSNV